MPSRFWSAFRPTFEKTESVARMSDPAMIKEIQATVTIPAMANSRIGRQSLEALGVDYIDESEVLTPCRRYIPC